MLPYNTTSQSDLGLDGHGGQQLAGVHQQLHPIIAAAQKRPYAETESSMLMDDNLDRPAPKKKGRKKSFIWAHVITDEFGKVHCKHCGALIRVNYGEKVKQTTV
jgi:hypothetical protein